MILRRESGRMGVITTSVHGSHVAVTVKLRNRFFRALNPETFALRILGFLEDGLKVAVLALALYIALEVGLAFLPHGPVARILGGGQ